MLVESVVVDVLSEGGTRIEWDSVATGLLVVMVSKFVYVLEDGRDGVG